MHEAAKLRVRLAKIELILPLGNKIATMADIITLKGCVSKDEHLLHDADVNLYDKMNYDACHRLTRPELDKLLETHVQGAQSLL